MKVEHLTGPALDYWVARAEGRKLERRPVPLGEPGEMEWFVANDAGDWMFDLEHWSPSTKWEHGGPIIERERATFFTESIGSTVAPASYWADMGNGIARYRMAGPTHLISAMRAFVASRFGTEVQDEPGTPS